MLNDIGSIIFFGFLTFVIILNLLGLRRSEKRLERHTELFERYITLMESQLEEHGGISRDDNGV